MCSHGLRVHGVKFQTVVFPNGLIINLEGQCEGQRPKLFLVKRKTNKFVDFTSQLKIGLGSVGRIYLVYAGAQLGAMVEASPTLKI